MNYTIKKVSEMTGLSIPTIRYYDKEGLLPDLQRKESGYRVFSDQDLEAIGLIACFKESGLTIREIRHFISLVRQGDITLPSCGPVPALILNESVIRTQVHGQGFPALGAAGNEIAGDTHIPLLCHHAADHFFIVPGLLAARL